VDNLAGIARQGAEQGAVSVHDDEAKLLVRLEQLTQGFGVEFVVAEVQRRVDGLEGFKVDVDLALLALGGDDFAAVDDEAIRGDLGVQFETLLGGRDSRENGETIDAGLDVGGGSLGPSAVCALIFAAQVREALHAQTLQPTSSQRARPGPWALCIVSRKSLRIVQAGHARIMSEIMLVPLPRAASRRLISFLTFHISMFFSASLGCGSFDDMVAVVGAVCV
jgi:hypothetical protein